MSLRKRVELAGRKLVVWLVARLLGVRRAPVAGLDPEPRILVVRLDERVGNLLLLTPLLSTLRARFPNARVDVITATGGRALLDDHPAVDEVLTFDKRALLAQHGPLRTAARLRRRGYDVAIDASNPTDPSVTQALLVRLSGASHTVGAAHGAFAALFTAPVSMDGAGPHEIDLRLRLLAPLPGDALVRATSYGEPLPPPQRNDVVVLNVGARLAEKMLRADDYAELARAIQRSGGRCVIAYGPKELRLAEAVRAQVPEAELAPPTALTDLAELMHGARAVVSCDTGPMHLAVAVGTPTCGVFVSTDPARYGYAEAPNLVLDARERPLDVAALERWLAAP